MNSGIKYAHTNIVAGDWKKLARFYNIILYMLQNTLKRFYHV